MSNNLNKNKYHLRHKSGILRAQIIEFIREMIKMINENKEIYPDCPIIMRRVEIGGYTKLQLNQKIKEHSIMMNAYANKLFDDDKFTTSDIACSLNTVELSARDIGFPEGATITQIFERAKEVHTFSK
jgi:hypothetical protein